MRTVKMLVLSPLVTAASASAPTAPARSRSSRSNPEPMIRSPANTSGSRRKALAVRSMMATVWPSPTKDVAKPDPTRPHPTTTTCTTDIQLGPPPACKERCGFHLGRRGLYVGAVDPQQAGPEAD